MFKNKFIKFSLAWTMLLCMSNAQAIWPLAHANNKKNSFFGFKKSEYRFFCKKKNNRSSWSKIKKYSFWTTMIVGLGTFTVAYVIGALNKENANNNTSNTPNNTENNNAQNNSTPEKPENEKQTESKNIYDLLDKIIINFDIHKTKYYVDKVICDFIQDNKVYDIEKFTYNFVINKKTDDQNLVANNPKYYFIKYLVENKKLKVGIDLISAIFPDTLKRSDRNIDNLKELQIINFLITNGHCGINEEFETACIGKMRFIDYAIRFHKLELLKHLLENGASLDAIPDKKEGAPINKDESSLEPEETNKIDWFKRYETTLYAGTPAEKFNETVEIIKTLIDHGAYVDQTRQYFYNEKTSSMNLLEIEKENGKLLNDYLHKAYTIKRENNCLPSLNDVVTEKYLSNLHKTLIGKIKIDHENCYGKITRLPDNVELKIAEFLF